MLDPVDMEFNTEKMFCLLPFLRDSSEINETFFVFFHPNLCKRPFLEL